MGTRVFADTTVDPVPVPAPVEQKTPMFLKSGAVDFPLLLIAIGFLVFGLLMVYSASWDFSFIWYGDAMHQFYRQLISLGIGLALAVFFALLDYHNLKKFALPAMLALIAFLFIELFIGGRRGFFNGSVQPSEFAKIIAIVYIAVWMYAKRDQIHDLQWGLFPLGVILGFICGLIYLQPDFSATVTVFLLGGLLFFLGGGDIKQIVILVIIASVAGVLVVKASSYNSTRMSDYFNGIIDLTKTSYHLRYSFEAIVMGSWLGVGIGLASTKLNGLPFAPTDSIYAVIAEELGLAGAAGTVLLYCLLVWRGLRIAQRAPDLLGGLLAAGLTFWIGAEALLNMLVMVGLMPFAGNALPFISYGGSSLVCVLSAIGIIMSVSRHIAPQAEQQEWSSTSESVDLRGRNRRRSLSRISRS